MPTLPTPGVEYGAAPGWGDDLNAAIESLHLAGTHAARPTTGIVTGTLYRCTDHDIVYRWDGAAWGIWQDVGAWTAYTPTLTGFPATIQAARYKQIGKTVHVMGRLTLTGGPTGVLRVGLPVAAHASAVDAFLGSVVGYKSQASVGVPRLLDATTVDFYSHGAASEWSAAVPWGWASGDTLRFSLTYEAA